MGQNLLTYELISPYRLVTSDIYAGAWTQRNGEWAMQVRPTAFYSNGTYAQILLNEIRPNTRYLFNLWYDTDDHLHTTYRRAGLQVIYDDDTIDYGTYGTESSTARGWYLQRYITPEGKSVKNIRVGYNYGESTFIRWDSFIVPYDEVRIKKNGQLITSQLSEGQSVASFMNGGGIESNLLIEY